MLDIGDFTIHICWCQHEEGPRKRVFSDVIQAVKMCSLRSWWDNLLCAHSDMFPQDSDPYTQLLRQASKNNDTQTISILNQIREVNAIVDNLVRASYIHWSYKTFGEQGQEYSVILQYATYFQELEWILDRTIWKQKDLNKWERARFKFIVIQIQRKSRDILNGLFQ